MLQGKTVLFLGSSVTYGEGDISFVEMMALLLRSQREHGFAVLDLWNDPAPLAGLSRLYA